MLVVQIVVLQFLVVSFLGASKLRLKLSNEGGSGKKKVSLSDQVIWDLYEAVGPRGNLFKLTVALNMARDEAGCNQPDLDFDLCAWLSKRKKASGAGRRVRSNSASSPLECKRKKTAVSPSKSDEFTTFKATDYDKGKRIEPIFNIDLQGVKARQLRSAEAAGRQKSPRQSVPVPARKPLKTKLTLSKASQSTSSETFVALDSSDDSQKTVVNSLHQSQVTAPPSMESLLGTPRLQSTRMSTTTSTSPIVTPPKRSSILKSSKEGAIMKPFGVCLLSRALMHGTFHVVLMLLDAGVAIHPHVIHWIVMLASEDALKKLTYFLELGYADFINHQDHVGLMPLHYLMLRLDTNETMGTEILPIMLKHGARLDGCDSNGVSAFFFFLKQVESSRNNYWEIVRLLFPRLRSMQYLQLEPGRELLDYFLKDVAGYDAVAELIEDLGLNSVSAERIMI